MVDRIDPARIWWVELICTLICDCAAAGGRAFTRAKDNPQDYHENDLRVEQGSRWGLKNTCL